MKNCFQSSGKFGRLILALLLALGLSASSRLSAQMAPRHHEPLASFDKRPVDSSADLPLPADRQPALAHLKELVPGAKVNVDSLLKSPRFVYSTSGLLTGPKGQNGAIPMAAASQIPAGDAAATIKAFLNEHRGLFGHGAEVLDSAKVARESVTTHNGLKTIVWEQLLDNIPVYRANLMGHVTKAGELVSIASQFVPNAAQAADAGTSNRLTLASSPVVSAAHAIVDAANDVGEKLVLGQVQSLDDASGPEKSQKFQASPLLNGPVYVHLVWVPMDAANLRLCWDVLLMSHARQEGFESLVDAQTGEIIIRHNRTCYISDASYRVFTSDSPAPMFPGLPIPANTQASLVARSLVVTSAVDVVASPNGWIPDGNNETLGNNLDAFLDRDGDGQPDVARPQGSPNRVFDFTQDLTQSPTTYESASIAQLFYWGNWYHDKLYELGFTESAGNYQTDNFNRGGIGGDPILAHCQFDANNGTADNSAFVPAPDGISGNALMFTFSGPTPDRDGSLDADVVLHEFTHGTSTRLVGGGAGIHALQPSGMGEGWSDFYALSLSSSSGNDVNGNYAAGAYASYQFAGLTQNYYFGIRHYPYTTDMTKNPFTLKDIDPTQIIPHTGVPLSPIYAFDVNEANEVHHQGEIWCVTLWEVRANLINKYGFSGNQLMLQLVTDGMKLSPVDPTFLEARDAILLADSVDNGGANFTEIWQGFAKRGMGKSAIVPANDSTIGILESYDLPGLNYKTNFVSGGNGNGLIDYNECNTVDILLTNAGTVTATGIKGVISTTTPGVTVATAQALYPDIAPGVASLGRTPFKISTSPSFVCGTTVALTLVLKSDQTTTTNTVFLASGLVGKAITFTSTNSPIIPDNDPTGVYCPIVVTNIDSPIRDVTVSLYITHTFDADLHLELISPDGTTVVLSANEGGSGDNYGAGCAPDSIRTTFDDAATIPISSGNPPFVGSFRPEQQLAAFSLKTGSSVNGVWQLHAIDQIALDQGILQCWSLSISPSVCLDGGGECPGADLGIAMSADPSPVRVSSNLTYTVTVTNGGPGTAKGVIVNQTLPANCVFVSATSSQGTAGYVGGFVSANIGTLAVGSTATVSVVVYSTAAGTISSTANVGSPTFDFNTANNSATVSTVVQFPTADMGVTMTASPNPVFAGGPLTYTIMVTNNGPFTASGVTLTVNLPPNINLVSKDITQGSFVAGSGNTLIASVGIVPVGSNIVATVIVRPTTPGNISAGAQVSVDNNTTDPFNGNNSASAANTVIAAADVAVSIVSAPNPVITTSNYTYFITVTNNGPVDATGVIINQTLPANMVVVSTNATTGVVSSNGPGSIVWTIPSLLNGTGALLTEVVTAPTIPFNAVSKTTNVISTAVISAQQGDANITNNTSTSITVVSVPIITVVPAATLLTAESIAPADGAIEPNETVTIQFGLRNIGNIPSTNLVATLLSMGGVTLPSGPQTYGVLVPSGPAISMPFSFTAGTNATITATLQLQDGASNLPPVTFSFALPTVTTYSNTAPITILDNAPASPYPSRIVVSNFTGFVGKVSVTLSNMNHTYPDDIDILLVHPSGRASILMSDAGGGFALVNASPTFDRTASAVVPDEGQIVTATYRPLDYEPGDLFPTNAPGGPYQANLSAFEGITPNGTWSLYVVDDTSGDFGIISNGWSLAITTITPVNKITDLAVGLALSPTNQLLTGATVVYTVGVTNNGPDTATAVVLTNVLPNGVTLVSATGATYAQSGQTLVFNLGNIPATSNALVVITGTVNATGALTDKAVVTGNEIDPNLANNAASVGLNASLPPADLAAALTVSANPVIVGSNLVYTLVVTNNGPSAALSVTGLLTYANMAFVSAIPSQGNVIHTGSTVQCNFGNLPVGNIATVVLSVTPSVVGVYTNTWSVSGGSSDSVSGNNSITNVLAVNPPAPIIVASGAALISENGLKNGAIDSGETVTIAFNLANVGVASTTNLVATLQASGGVTPITTSRSYSPLSAGASGSQSFTFQATGVSGAPITATLALTDNSYSLGTVVFNFTIPGTFSSTNTGGLIIPSSGPAAPYPSVLNVTGLTGLVSKVVVNITGLTHSFPDDIDMILVNPTGQKVILMSDVGGAHSITNVNLTIADAASASLPDVNQIVSGTYKPTDFEPGDVFPGLSGPPSGPTLASLNGFPPNGNWSLYIVDDTAGDSGSISNWTLSLTTASTINPAANLTLTTTATPDPAYGGNYVTYSVVVANSGPSSATNVVLTDTLPSGTTLVSAVASQGTVNTNVVGTVTAALGTIAANANASASIRVRTSASGTIVNLASVTSDAVDLDPDDNSITKTSTVLDAPSASLVAATTTNGLTLTLIGQPNQPYAVQIATNLGSPTNWVSVATNIAGPNGTFIYTDPQLHALRRFYRAMRLSQ